ncbi:hypothetical protein GIB67_018942 [Kingdonia uniflora]|uniref:RRM domain-containing protein n=1 Tax=Kingdonia uniflora TaxID=39325 RepID=A0A7J7L2T4_9MAGN|nr:hypothetical protein GIB67_018942 [Kingdonia uniflora]
MDSDRAKLFVGGISWETTEDNLKDHFNSYGEVVEVVVMKDRVTGNARGFGFVLFLDPDVADKALDDKHVILGRTVEVKKAVPRGEQQQYQNQQQNKGYNKSSSNGGSNYNNQLRTKKIFVGGLSASVTEEEFKGYFEKFGMITDVVVMYDNETHRPRGFGFITFDSEEAVDSVMQKSFHELNEKLVEVKRAVPKDASNNSGFNNNNYNMRMGAGRGSPFGNYQTGLYPPYIPRYGMYTGYAPSAVPGYVSPAGYPYYGGYGVGGYPIGYGMSPRSPWNRGAMVDARRSPIPYGNGASYGYMNSGMMGMYGGGVRGVMSPVADGKWNQGYGVDSQMGTGTTPERSNSEKLDDDSSGLTLSHNVSDEKQSHIEIEGRFRPYPNSS